MNASVNHVTVTNPLIHLNFKGMIMRFLGFWLALTCVLRWG